MAHAALLLLGVALVLVLQQAALLALPRLAHRRDRQRLSGLVLALPPLVLALLAADIMVMVWRGCIHNWTVPDAWASGLLIGAWLTLATQAAGRLLLRQRLQATDLAVLAEAPAGPASQLAVDLAARLGLSSAPEVAVYQVDRPLAATVGWRRPRVILSTWLLEHLSARELEGVLAHELIHARGRDPLWLALGGWSRACAGGFPAVRHAWATWLEEQELATDRQAAALTRRPAALASALLKCWEGAPLAPTQAPGFGAADAGDVERRIASLLNPPGDRARPALPGWLLTGLVMGLAALVASPLVLMPNGLLFSCHMIN